MSRMSVHTLQRALFCAFNFRPDIPSCHHLRIKEIPQCVTVVLPQCHPPSLSVIAESPMTSLSARVILRRRVAIDVTWLAGHFRSVWPDDWRSRDPSAKAKVWHIGSASVDGMTWRHLWRQCDVVSATRYSPSLPPISLIDNIILLSAVTLACYVTDSQCSSFQEQT